MIHLSGFEKSDESELLESVKDSVYIQCPCDINRNATVEANQEDPMLSVAQGDGFKLLFATANCLVIAIVGKSDC